MTCAARRATGETADASEHYREGSEEGASLPEEYIVGRCVLALHRGKISAKHRHELRNRHQDVEGAYLGLYFGNGHRDEPCTECFPNGLG
jgi:hypothetical protein